MIPIDSLLCDFSKRAKNINKEQAMYNIKEYREAAKYAEKKDKTLQSNNEKIFNCTITIKHLDGTILILEHAFAETEITNHEDYLIVFTENHGWFVYEITEIDWKLEKY